MLMGRNAASAAAVAAAPGKGDTRFLLRSGGGSFTARSRLLRMRRPGVGVGVANAKGGSVELGGL